ncbi:MAG TPA: GreA/GreB family elongation factor [Polyangiaceae bacterium]|nr:GreA/GreB family elongation factor [Polyangiaceae bacterium]
MSRAFVKEDTSEPPLVVPRAPLPEGTPNYVTRRGLALLRDERAVLEAARPDPEAPGGAAALSAHHARLSALEARINSAQVLDAATLPHDEVRFSALVSLRGEAGAERRYRIVGVDEADARSGRIAFTAPLAVALAGKRVGDVVSLRQPGGEVELEIVGIDYAQEPAQ